jgi:hypothetical protein
MEDSPEKLISPAKHRQAVEHAQEVFQESKRCVWYKKRTLAIVFLPSYN